MLNALYGKNRAITDETPGLTRDVLEVEIRHKGHRFLLSDLPGLDIDDPSDLEGLALQKAKKHLEEMDLIILLLGGNQVWPVTYERLMGDLVDRLREALPGASVLITSPVDQVESILAWQSVPSLAQAARQNRKVAEEKGTAFWDFRGAMGGDASMARFIVTGMGRADGIHLSPKGAAYMGRRMLYALWRDLDAYLASHPEAGCELRHDGASASR